MADLDLFCQREKIQPDILGETQHWFVKLGVGIATPGHVMAITKTHFDCLADVPDEILNEYERFLHPLLSNYIMHRFSNPFNVEYGIFGQTVPHAHVHYIPKKGNGYVIQSVRKEILTKGNVAFEDGTRQKMRDTRASYGRYNLFIDGKSSFICPIPRDMTPEDSSRLDDALNYRVFLKEMGGKVPLSWANITPEEAERDKLWRDETRRKFSQLPKLLL